MNKLFISTSPHIKSDESTRTIMIDVLFALFPALVMSIIYFGIRAFIITLISVVSCVVFEFTYRKLMKKSVSITNASAIVTGLLLAFCLPPTVPFWIPIIGAFFAIVIVKELFGGIGKNFVNPALAARAFLFSWVTIMTSFTEPLSDTLTHATTLDILKHGKDIATPKVFDMLIGNMSGCLGETAALFLIIGGIYLIYRKVIKWHIPVVYIATVAALTYLFPRNSSDNAFYFMVTNLLSGGLILGAIFMATDYTTTPLTKWGKIIFAFGCGVLTVVFRYYSGNAEGVCFSILIMNCVSPLIDKITIPTRYGTGGGAVNV